MACEFNSGLKLVPKSCYNQKMAELGCWKATGGRGKVSLGHFVPLVLGTQLVLHKYPLGR